MTIDALVWVPRMLYLHGEQNMGLPQQWFTRPPCLLRDVAVMALCALVIRQIYRPQLDLVRFGGRIDDPTRRVFDGAADSPPQWLRLRSGTPDRAAEAESAGVIVLRRIVRKRSGCPLRVDPRRRRRQQDQYQGRDREDEADDVGGPSCRRRRTPRPSTSFPRLISLLTMETAHPVLRPAADHLRSNNITVSD